MFRQLRTLFARILSDLSARRNIEVYVVSLVAIVLAVLGVIEDIVPDQVKTSAILAALALLVFHISVPESGGGTLDDYLDDRSNFKPFPETLVGVRELWIYAPSAANILRGDNLDAVRNEVLSHKSGQLRVLIQDPEQIDAVALLRKQLDDNVQYQVQDLPEEIDSTLRRFEMIASWKMEGKFEYALMPFGPGFSLVILDAHKATGRVIVEVHGFHNESTNGRMHLTITRQDSERWFVYWVDQFERMWDQSRQVEA